MKRTPIPKMLKQRILEEAGYRCAIAACKQRRTIVVHHIVPYRECKAHRYPNLICLCRNCHDSADRGEISRSSLYRYKKKLQEINESYSEFECNILTALSSGESVTLPEVLLSLVHRIEKDQLVELIPIRKGASSCHVRLTEDGTRLMKER